MQFLFIAALLPCIALDLWAHGNVGQRKFIEPLFTEDANIKDELIFPRAEFLAMPDGSLRSYTAAFEKTLYPNRWSVVIEQSRVHRRVARSMIGGFGDLEVGTKFAVYRSAEHELVLTPALFLTVPTGSQSVAEHRTKLHPALVFAKGFGDLKWAWLRPLGLQGDLGYEAAVRGEHERQATYDMVLEYSVPYLNSSTRNADTRFDVKHDAPLGRSLRAVLGNSYPFVEFNGSTPVAGTTGSSSTFLRPGFAYVGRYFQISAAPDVPLRGYLPSRRIGTVVLIDLFLNEAVPAFGWTPFGKHHHHDVEH
ncbi:hypothetical protein [Candidatus Korobacter versatilis]|nr:hypothetical protein [Candidatus Koribacter versatilis]